MILRLILVFLALFEGSCSEFFIEITAQGPRFENIDLQTADGQSVKTLESSTLINGSVCLPLQALQSVHKIILATEPEQNPLSLEVEIYLAPDHEPKEVGLLYSSSLPSGPDTIKAFNTATLPRGVWTKLVLWLPNFAKGRVNPDIQFFYANSSKSRVFPYFRGFELLSEVLQYDRLQYLENLQSLRLSGLKKAWFRKVSFDSVAIPKSAGSDFYLPSVKKSWLWHPLTLIALIVFIPLTLGFALIQSKTHLGYRILLLTLGMFELNFLVLIISGGGGLHGFWQIQEQREKDPLQSELSRFYALKQDSDRELRDLMAEKFRRLEELLQYDIKRAGSAQKLLSDYNNRVEAIKKEPDLQLLKRQTIKAFIDAHRRLPKIEQQQFFRNPSMQKLYQITLANISAETNAENILHLARRIPNCYYASTIFLLHLVDTRAIRMQIGSDVIVANHKSGFVKSPAPAVNLVEIFLTKVFFGQDPKFKDENSYGVEPKIYEAIQKGRGYLNSVFSDITYLDYFINSPLQLLKPPSGTGAGGFSRLMSWKVAYNPDPQFLRADIENGQMFLSLCQKFINQEGLYAISDGHLDSFPLLIPQSGEFDYFAALCKTKMSHLYEVILENSQPVAYISLFNPGERNLISVLRLPLQPRLDLFTSRLNKGVFIFFGIVLLALILAAWLSMSITKPLLNLKSGIRRIAKGDLSQSIPLTGVRELSLVASSFNSMLSALQQKKIIGDFVSSMAMASLKNKKSDSTRTSAVVLFVGLHNIHALEEIETQEDTIQTIHQFICLVQDKLVEFNGEIDKFTGVAVLGIFRHHLKLEDSLKMAHELRIDFQEMNRSRKDAQKIPLKIGIGLALGELVLGHVGSDTRRDFTVIGNTVNMAARLYAYSKGSNLDCQILVDEMFFENHPAKLRFMGEVAIKGKSMSQKIFELP